MLGRKVLLLALVLAVGCARCNAETRQHRDAQPADSDTPVDADRDPHDGGDEDRDQDLPASDELEVALEASRSSGVAPLAVFFDASGTVTPNTDRPFHAVQFEWSFGDASSGTWATTGLSRNQASGPLAAHVYERPGRYVTTVTATDPAGETESRQVEILVDDPDEVFAGESTICVSNGGDFAGAPEGARQVTASSLGEVSRLLATGTRVLLRRGESWSATAGDHIRLNTAGPGILGAFGEGEPPLLSTAADANAIELSGSTPTLRDFRIMDLAVAGSGGTSMAVTHEGMANQILLLRLHIRGVHSAIGGGDDILDFLNAHGSPGHSFHDQMAIVETRVEDLTELSAIYLVGERFMFLGNDFNQTGPGHNLRMPFLHRAVLSHNLLSGAGAGKGVVKLHSAAYDEPGLGYHRLTEFVLFSHNVFTGTNGDWMVVMGPQHNAVDERLRNVIVERNLFLLGPATRIPLVISAQDVTARNNVFNLTGGIDTACALVETRGIEQPPARVHFYNNTCFSGGTSSARLVEIGDTVSDTVLINNLVAGPSSGSEPALLVGGTGSGLVERSNIVTRTPGFIVEAPSEASHFALAAGSAAIDAGEVVPGLLIDFTGAIRPVDGNGSGTAEVDVGAFEFAP